MIRVSTLIGEITDTTPTINRVHTSNGSEEQFYSITVQFRDFTIPVLVSEYNLEQIVPGRVRVTGSLISDYFRQKIPVFYILSNKIEPVDSDTELTNEVNFSGTVTKVKDKVVDTAGRDVLPMILAFTTPLDTQAILYLSIKNKLARENCNRKPKFQVSGTGRIKPYKDVYEIHVTQIDFN